MVTDEWSLELEHVLSSGHDIVVAQVDCVGSWGPGVSWSRLLVGHIGVRDTECLAEVTRFIMEHYNIDTDRVGVMGAEYGGYLALKLVTDVRTAGDMVSCAIIQSPVTNWRQYGRHLNTIEFINFAAPMQILSCLTNILGLTT